MTFYNDKWIIADKDSNNILLFRKATNDILLDRINKDTNITNKESIVKDVLEEYDIAIGLENKIYMIYQNQAMHLILSIFDGNSREDIKLTAEQIPEVFDLNIMVYNNTIHIVYVIRLLEEGKYRIYHHYYDNEDWGTYRVEDIIARKLLNPIKLIQEENNIILTYYNNDKDIELKSFSSKDLAWSDASVLVNNPNEKLYLDMIKRGDTIHLSYSEFQNGNLVIKYEKFIYNNGIYKKEVEEIISNEGSFSYPTIIIYEDDIWITWVELDNIISRFSNDKGKTWSSCMYMWNEGKSRNLVRYKYLTTAPENNKILDYSFGSVYPEVIFIGFGPTDDTIEIPIKKDNFIHLQEI